MSSNRIQTGIGKKYAARKKVTADQKNPPALAVNPIIDDSAKKPAAYINEEKPKHRINGIVVHSVSNANRMENTKVNEVINKYS